VVRLSHVNYTEMECEGLRWVRVGAAIEEGG
jgi:hypothetical protein